MTKALLDDEARVTLGDGQEYVIAALSLDEVVEAETLFEDLNGTDIEASKTAARTILGYALARRHPDVTGEFITRRLLTLRNLTKVLTSIFLVSGMMRAEGEAPGEAKAG